MHSLCTEIKPEGSLILNKAEPELELQAVQSSGGYVKKVSSSLCIKLLSNQSAAMLCFGKVPLAVGLHSSPATSEPQ